MSMNNVQIQAMTSRIESGIARLIAAGQQGNGNLRSDLMSQVESVREKIRQSNEAMIEGLKCNNDQWRDVVENILIDALQAISSTCAPYNIQV